MTDTPRYRVKKLYDNNGNVAAHFLDPEFYSFSASWEQAMANPNFASIIDRDIIAERRANDSLEHLATYAPNSRVRAFYLRWLHFIDRELDPWTTGGAIHFRPHWARVLMLALTMGDAAGLSDADLDALAAAAVFHDSRRKNPYLDTGHGDRAAHYYADFCTANRENAGASDTEAAQTAETGTFVPATVSPEARQHSPEADASDNHKPATSARAVTASSTGSDGAGNHAPSAADAAAESGLPGFDPRAYLAMQWHDRDDDQGLQVIAAALDRDELPTSSPSKHARQPLKRADDAFHGMDHSTQLTPDGLAKALPEGADADAATLYRMFKDADGLDRIRLGEGGLDPHFLRFQYAHDTLPLARQLLAASE